MIIGNAEFFNIAEIGEGGRLLRFPQAVTDGLGMPVYDESGRETEEIFRGHRNYAYRLTNCEIRFVSDADKIAVRLRTEQPVEVSVYQGDYFNDSAIASPGESELAFSRYAQADGLNESQRNRFAHNVWRVVLNGDGATYLLGIEGGKMRPPAREELPRMRILAYGSSITQGVGTPYPRLNYLSVAEQILGVEFLNKGIGSGCFCEPAMLDYFLSETYDALYFELGTNIANRPPAAIEGRLGPFIDAVCAHFRDKKIFFMTPIKGFSDVSPAAADYAERFANSRSVIRSHAEKFENAVLLDGHALVGRDWYLKADVLHPSDFGHVMMGVTFAEMLKKYL